MTRYLMPLAHERFQPDELLQQSLEAEQAGFDAVCCSDHLEPWWAPDAPTPAACGNAWVWLGAVGQATTRVSLGTAVTGVIHRYHPVVLAQQLQRTEEALTVATRLLDGETVDFSGDFFAARRAQLHVENARRPPVYLSAFNPGAANGSREWKGTLVDEHYTDAVADPAEIGRNGEQVPDAEFVAMSIVSSDPDTHVQKLREVEGLGPTAICVVNCSGADPLGTIRTYGESVLPALRR